jgi:hypothetical protein
MRVDASEKVSGSKPLSVMRFEPARPALSSEAHAVSTAAHVAKTATS